jgi:hypothetical protein
MGLGESLAERLDLRLEGAFLLFRTTQTNRAHGEAGDATEQSDCPGHSHPGPRRLSLAQLLI